MGPLQTKWVEALESGKYQQGAQYLCRDNKFCCLGVACEVLERPKEVKDGVVFYDRCCSWMENNFDLMGLRDKSGAYGEQNEQILDLSKLNDEGMSFKDIAAFIRENEKAIFKEER